MRFIIVTTAYNCENWVSKCIHSIKRQTFDNYLCFIFDDLSTDSTALVAANAIADDSRFAIIRNNKKYYQTGNYDKLIRSTIINDSDIIIEVDGDDWLPDENVFQRISILYCNSSLWLTYGQFKYSNGGPGISRPINNNENLRVSNFCVSHLRTWKAFLWRNIKQTDLYYSNSWYPESGGDVFFMLPMLEMATQNHFKFISQINYIYNELNPLNDNKVSLKKQNHFANYARRKMPYTALDIII